MLRRVALVRTDVSEECIASIIRVTRIDRLGTTLAVTSNRSRLRRQYSSASSGGYQCLKKGVLPLPLPLPLPFRRHRSERRRAHLLLADLQVLLNFPFNMITVGQFLCNSIYLPRTSETLRRFVIGSSRVRCSSDVLTELPSMALVSLEGKFRDYSTTLPSKSCAIR
jgi:hypothetical protein